LLFACPLMHLFHHHGHHGHAASGEDQGLEPPSHVASDAGSKP
jgi:hypothetical protein